MSKRVKTGGMQKGFKYTKNKVWYNNGVIETQIFEGSNIPEGFIRGRLKSNKPAWNRGLTKETDDRVKKISDSCSKRTHNKVRWTDEYINSIINNSMYDFWWDFGKTKLIKFYNMPSWVWEICVARLGLYETDDHRLHMYSVTYNEDWRKKQSSRLKGKNTWSKGSVHSKEQVNKFKNTFSKRTLEQRKLAKEREYITKKHNKSFNASKTEEDYYNYLISLYGKQNVIHIYYDKERYPYNCDFYIKSEDLFIECNFHWTHGNKPYDSNDEECQKQLELWLEKAKTSQFYRNAIDTWTIRDVEKVKCAKKNNLNYKVIYSWKVIK